METLSPMISTFFSVVEGCSGGPGLHTHFPVTLATVAVPAPVPDAVPTAGVVQLDSDAAAVEGTQVVTSPHPGQLVGTKSEHLVPFGQQVREFLQHTASFQGQQPIRLPLNSLLQHWLALGHDVAAWPFATSHASHASSSSISSSSFRCTLMVCMLWA